MWFENCTMYQIYPIGFCGAPRRNDGALAHRLDGVCEVIPHLKQMNVTAVMFNPVLKSSSHGYDTIDFYNVDNRLGDNSDFAALVARMHENGIKVMYDSVFNHVGREFPQFIDVLHNKRDSNYKDWFYIDFDGNSPYNDGFAYKDWDGCAELVKLNLDNPQVTEYLLDAVRFWIKEFDIDGLRLDVARLLPSWFFEKLNAVTRAAKPDFPLVGEVIRIHEHVHNVTPDRLTSLTDYECFTGMIRSINQPNFFEIAHSIERNFASGGIFYKKPLLNFVDNHDVTRAATAIHNPKNLKVLYALLFALPGVPCIYYGSEFAAKGDNKCGDEPLRPAYSEIDKSADLSDIIKNLIRIRSDYADAVCGEYKKLFLSNSEFVMARGELVYAFNVSDCVKTLSTERGAFTVPAHGFIIVNNGNTLATA